MKPKPAEPMMHFGTSRTEDLLTPQLSQLYQPLWMFIESICKHVGHDFRVGTGSCRTII